MCEFLNEVCDECCLVVEECKVDMECVCKVNEIVVVNLKWDVTNVIAVLL